jgi:phage terminase large subunit GpA-like protein
MSEHKIEMTGPVPCPKCGEGLMLAFARPHFKAGEKTDRQFSHYENYYKCSRCGYEIRGSKENMNMMKEGEHETDQDAGDNRENGDDEGDEHRDEVDSWQRRRDLK